MRVLSILLVALAAGLGSAARGAALEAYAQPTLEQVVLSPDASHLAAMVRKADGRRILIKRIADGAVELDVPIGPTATRDIRWAGDGHLLITTEAYASIANARGPTRLYWTVVDLDLAARKLFPVLDGVRNTANVATGWPIVRRVAGPPLMLIPGIGFVNGDANSHVVLFKFDPATHHSAVVWTGEARTTDFVVNGAGEVVARTQFDSATGRWWLDVRRGDGWKTVKELAAGLDPPRLIGLGRTPGTVLLKDALLNGGAYREVSVEAGDWPEPMAEAPATATPVFGLDDQLVGFREFAAEQDTFHFFDPQEEKLRRLLTASLPGQRVEVVSRAAGGRRLIVLADSPTEGLAYASLDTASRKASWIGAAYQQLAPDDIAAVRAVAIQAADGLRLSGYLTLPTGRAATALPLIVLVHGGPDARDRPGFDWWSQALASRGYAVLRLNFRGSYGFGSEFERAGHGQWGRKMQTDLSDAVRALAQAGTVDPQRVCIAGAGYGGYAALAGVTLEQRTYRCAVAIDSIADLRGYLATRNAPTARWLKRYIGVERLGDSSVLEVSPAAHADAVRAPVLLIDGRDDVFVPAKGVEGFAASLKRLGRPVQLELIDKTGEVAVFPEARLRMLQLMTTFLEANNPPR